MILMTARLCKRMFRDEYGVTGLKHEHYEGIFLQNVMEARRTTVNSLDVLCRLLEGRYKRD